MAEPQDDPREKALSEYRRKLVQHKEASSRVRALRDDVNTVKKEYDKTEDDLKALQSVGQIIGEVLRQLDEERCECPCRVLTPASRWQGAIGEGARQAPAPPAERGTLRLTTRRRRRRAPAHTSPAARPAPPPLQSSSSPAAGRATWWDAAARSTAPS